MNLLIKTNSERSSERVRALLLTNLTNSMAKYKPAYFLAQMIKSLGLNSMGELSIKVDIDPALLCKMRQGNIPIRGQHILRFHEVTGLSVKELRLILGDDYDTGYYVPPSGKPLRWGCK